MIILFRKINDNMIVGRPQWRINNREKRIDNISYSFISNVSITDMPRSQFYDIVYDWLLNCVRIPLTNVKDMEFPCDIPSGNLGVRFTLVCGKDVKELTNNTYAAAARWCLQSSTATSEEVFDEYPVEHEREYEIFVGVEPLSLEEVEFFPNTKKAKPFSA